MTLYGIEYWPKVAISNVCFLKTFWVASNATCLGIVNLQASIKNGDYVSSSDFLEVRKSVVLSPECK